MSAGNYDDAVPVLQEAVNSFPPDTQDLNYAYALFNLGKSLRLAGRPDEAIPVLREAAQDPEPDQGRPGGAQEGEAGSRQGLGGEPATAGRSELLRAGRSRDLSAAR